MSPSKPGADLAAEVAARFIDLLREQEVLSEAGLEALQAALDSGGVDRDSFTQILASDKGQEDGSPA